MKKVIFAVKSMFFKTDDKLQNLTFMYSHK